MEIGCMKDLNIDVLKGVWKCGYMVLEIRPDNIIMLGIDKPFEENTNIKYLEGANFVELSDNLIIKQIFNDDSISILYSKELYTFKKVI